MSLSFRTPFKTPLRAKPPPAERPSRAAATSCKEKLSSKIDGIDDDESDEDEYFSQTPSNSSNSSKPKGLDPLSRKRPLGDKSNLNLVKRPNVESVNNTEGQAGSSGNMTLGLNRFYKASSWATLCRPFKTPYKDPKRQAESALINPLSIVLGMRPAYNSNTILNPRHDPDAPGALVLYRPKKMLSATEKIAIVPKISAALAGKKASEGGLDEIPEIPVVVDPKLGSKLRPHQVEGVKFLYDCVTGKRVEGAFGCIMADEMGLGKTLQCITLLWTVLKQSPTPRKVIADKIVIVCPSTLVANWEEELIKWLGVGKIRPIICDHKATAALSAKAQLKAELLRFRGRSRCNSGNEVLIISYETLRGNIEELGKQAIGLLICDEGHRLKNANNLTYTALNGLNVKRRVIITGTPIQNDLEEYYALHSFANPNLLGTPSEFRRNYEIPIMDGRDALATEKQRQIGDEKLRQLNSVVGPCMIRRTNDLLNKYLPTKYEYVVFTKLSPVQERLYEFFLNSKVAKKLLAGQDTQPLQSITLLKKLSNHPNLLDLLEDLPGCEEVLPELVHEKASAGSRAVRVSARDGGGSNIHIEWSSKLMLLDRMLSQIKRNTSDRVVLISNYTQTLDLFEKLCQLRGHSFLRLDGTMNIKKRKALVSRFNDPLSTDFAFLLSSKAGGCGINLIGANRLVLFDPDWNPAADQQALARVWRDGQKKVCFIYRVVAAGTIEEKIFQRQSHKQTLSSCVVDDGADLERHYSKDDLRDLFTNNTKCTTDTHNTFKCKSGCDRADRPGTSYGDLSSWTHFSPKDRLRFADNILKCAAADVDILAYVFQFKSHEPEKENKD